MLWYYSPCSAFPPGSWLASELSAFSGRRRRIVSVTFGPDRGFGLMRKARYFVALSCACASAGCGTEVAMAVYPFPADGGIPGVPEKPPPQCASTKLTDRLS